MRKRKLNIDGFVSRMKRYSYRFLSTIFLESIQIVEFYENNNKRKVDIMKLIGEKKRSKD